MRRRMIAKVHLHDDGVEPRNFRHESRGPKRWKKFFRLFTRHSQVKCVWAHINLVRPFHPPLSRYSYLLKDTRLFQRGKNAYTNK
jgi:hypothetical protein